MTVSEGVERIKFMSCGTTVNPFTETNSRPPSLPLYSRQHSCFRAYISNMRTLEETHSNHCGNGTVLSERTALKGVGRHRMAGKGVQ